MLYRCLARGARAVLQLYAENMDQSEMIMSYAMRSGFAGGMVVDWPHRYSGYEFSWSTLGLHLAFIDCAFEIESTCRCWFTEVNVS